MDWRTTRTRTAWAIVLLAAFALMGCGTSSSSSSGSTPIPAPAPAAASLLLKSDSGTDRAADGTWSACYNSNTEREDHIHSGTTLTINNYVGTSGTAGCAGGTLVSTTSGIVTLSAQATAASAGWETSGSLVSAPARVGGGYLNVTPTVSQFSAAGTIGTGTVNGTMLLFVDDSAATYQMWRGGNSSDCQTASYTSGICMFAADPLLK